MYMYEHSFAFRDRIGGTVRCISTRRPLTHSLDLGEEGLAVKATRPSIEARFWAKVNKDGPIPAHRPELGPCWVWTASTMSVGYGQFYMGKLMGAHVASWILAHDAALGDMRVLHHCDNRLCVRPAHLFAGTQLDNVRDMISKGRRTASAAKGERNSHAKLTASQVVEIRQRFEAGELGVSLAAEFGVKFNAISRIVTGLTWTHAGGPIRPVDHPRRRHHHQPMLEAS
jgi:hypothetical protein